MTRRRALAALASLTGVGLGSGLVRGPMATNQALAAVTSKAAKQAAAHLDLPAVTIIISKDYAPLGRVDDQRLRQMLTRAVLDFIQDRYPGDLPLWGKPLAKVDLEKRIYHIAYWVIQGVREHASIYPVDPSWVLSQILIESFFYEFAVSWAFAVGVCQFIPSTARSYGMLTATDSPAHFKPPYKLPELAGEYAHYREVLRKRSELRRAHPRFAGHTSQRLEQALKAMVAGESLPDAAEQLEYMRAMEDLELEVQAARKLFRTYLQANFEGLDIFESADARFLDGFDQRTLYRRPVPAMVRMLAEGLNARHGNMLAAAAAFHAGLSNTRDSGFYADYGRLPSIESTVGYVSRIVVIHHEISARLG